MLRLTDTKTRQPIQHKGFLDKVDLSLRPSVVNVKKRFRAFLDRHDSCRSYRCNHDNERQAYASGTDSQACQERSLSRVAQQVCVATIQRQIIHDNG